MIDKYLIASCLSILDILNEQYSEVLVRSTKLRKIAKKHSETDLVFKVGHVFRQQAMFERLDIEKGESESGRNDIAVEYKDFKIEVKYLKVHKSNDGTTDSNKVTWKAIKSDFDWLVSEIEQGHKGKRAFIIGWFNATERFADQMQLALSTKLGNLANQVAQDRIFYFPFVKYDTKTNDTQTIEYIYEDNIDSLAVFVPGTDVELDCVFFGNKEDVFHIAMYY